MSDFSQRRLNINRLILGVAISLLCLASGADAADKPMTNQDVISMLKAKMSERTILLAIKSSTPGFDASASELIKLSAASASDAIVQAVIEATSRAKGESESGAATGDAGKGGGSTSATSGSPASGAMNPEEVLLIDGENRLEMKYLAPQMRMVARALGLGGVGQYASLNGVTAALHVKSRKPSFIVSVPNNAQPESYFTIANFAVRKSGTREVSVGGGYYSYTSGINKDRVVKANAEKEANQSKAPKRFTVYRVTPTESLPAGEYAFILYNSQVKVAGYFATGLDSYFDFGVD